MKRNKHYIFVLASILFLISSCFYSSTTVSALEEPPPANGNSPSTVASLLGPPIQFLEDDSYIRLNFTSLVVEFYKGTFGYNKIYNYYGDVLVYDDRIVLEYWTGSQWKQRGTSTGVSWIKIDDHSYHVTRHYTDYVGTSYNVTYKIRSDSPMKISISLTSGQTDEYRLGWYPSGITKVDYEEKPYSITFGADLMEDFQWITFDWEDVYQSFGDITQTSIETVAQGRKANIYFSIGIVNAGKTLIIDPSTVGTTQSDAATGNTFQRKTFLDETWNRYWAFYGISAGQKINYTSSTDGINWDEPTVMTEDVWSHGRHWSVYWDGTYVHFGMAGISNIYYTRGQLNGTGNGWVFDSSVLVANGSYRTPSICVDSDGYPWIGASNYTDSTYETFVVNATATNGTSWNSPVKIDGENTTNAGANVIPLTDGKVYIIYLNGSKHKGMLWNGTSLGSQEDIAGDYGTVYHMHSAVAHGDDVYFAYSATPTLRWRWRDYDGGGWQTEATLEDTDYTQGQSVATLTVDSSTGYIRAFWAHNNIFYMKVYNTSSWGSSSNPFGTVEETSLQNWTSVTSFYQVWDNKIGVTWVNGSSSPYDVRYAFMTMDSTAPTYSNIATNTTLAGRSCDFTVDWSDNVGLSGHIFSWNETGSWANETFVPMTGTSNSSSTVKTLNSTVGKAVGWRVYANDTSNNCNNTGIQTLTTTGYALTLQARDTDGTNLPRQVAFKGTYVDSSTFEENSDSNGLKQLTVAYGTLTVNTWWGNHLVDSSRSVSVTGDKTENINTKIARLDSGSYYVLISINETTLPSPEVVGTKDWKMLGVSGSGSKQLKIDGANWVTAAEPEVMRINGDPYETGWTWDSTNKIFAYLLDLTGTAKNIEISYTPLQQQPSGTTTGTTTTVTVTPIQPPDDDTQPYNGTTTIIPQYVPEEKMSLQIPTDTILLVIGGGVLIVVAAYAYNWWQNQGSLGTLYEKKSRSKTKPNWRKKRK